jgi:energy-coupling factor transporter ATP-binding protein EcfA2
VAIPDKLDSTHPLDLPFAMRKRLALAVTLAAGSPWILLDEPSLAQDGQNTLAIRALSRRMADAGFGVIIISHSPSMARDLTASSFEIKDRSIVHGIAQPKPGYPPPESGIGAVK